MAVKVKPCSTSNQATCGLGALKPPKQLPPGM